MNRQMLVFVACPCYLFFHQDFTSLLQKPVCAALAGELLWSMLLETFQGHHSPEVTAVSSAGRTSFICIAGPFQAAAATQRRCTSGSSQQCEAPRPADEIQSNMIC